MNVCEHFDWSWIESSTIETGRIQLSNQPPNKPVAISIGLQSRNLMECFYHHLLSKRKLVSLLLVAAMTLVSGDLKASAVINGNLVTIQEQEDKGLVSLANGCSAVLLANDWLLTAGHCISNNRNSASVTAIANWESVGNQLRQSDAIYQYAGFNDLRNVDLALVHLAAPFTVHGATTGFVNQLNTNSVASLAGKTVAAYGVGINAVPRGGSGIWRAGDLAISAVGSDSFTILPNGAGQITAPGDSGGPHFIFQNGVPLITGIQSGASWNCSDQTSSATCKSTITQIVSASPVSIPAVHERLRAVLASQWHPNVISEPIWVLAGEIQGTRWGFTDVNQVNWAQAARSAAAMCYNRTFSAGHFDGHQNLALGGYGIQCSGRGVFWSDVTVADIASTGWGFTDINTVSWTRANRAAERLCAGFGQNFAGGQFNGHQVNGNYGLYCYRDGARWFDATTAEIAATGWGWASGDMDTEPWAQGARAATGFCRGKGYSGGFMNGQIDRGAGLYGVVCQGNTFSGGTSPLPTMALNYTNGSAGSFFTLRGTGFPPNSADAVHANGHLVAPVQIDSTGSFSLNILTSPNDSGQYILESNVNASSRVQFALEAIAPFRAQELSGEVCNLQGHCTTKPLFHIFLPLVRN